MHLGWNLISHLVGTRSVSLQTQILQKMPFSTFQQCHFLQFMHSIPWGGSSICGENWFNTLIAKVSWSCRWGLVQTLEAISCRLFHHEACRCPRGPCILEGFPSFFEGNAKDWLYYLAPRSITSWDDLKGLFLAKFFPTSRTTAIRKEISSIKQQSSETLYEY